MMHLTCLARGLLCWLISTLTLNQIFNADETGIYWLCLPTCTLAGCNEKSACGFKINKEWLTVLLFLLMLQTNMVVNYWSLVNLKNTRPSKIKRKNCQWLIFALFQSSGTLLSFIELSIKLCNFPASWLLHSFIIQFDTPSCAFLTSWFSINCFTFFHLLFFPLNFPLL